MNWVVAKIKWILLASGALTCALLYAAVMPNEAVDFLFGRTLESELSQVVVPSWGALVGLVGALLIYAAFVPEVRTLVMTAAGSSKLIFVGLMLANGRQYLGKRIGLVLALDVVMVSLFALFLFEVHRTRVRRVPLREPTVVSHSAAPTAPRPESLVRPSVRPPVAKAR